MKNLLILATILLTFGFANAQLDPNASPENVMNTIFQAAKTGEVWVLRFLLPPYDDIQGRVPCDGDCKALCNPGNEQMLEEFKSAFSRGKIIGSPTISENSAEVNFVFGPNLEANETMNMQRINGKWYLESY